uniref:Venom protein n=1 Tax=Hadrurus spadix TaxID=141984 RepID=A0A1W7R978_9SCOR
MKFLAVTLVLLLVCAMLPTEIWGLSEDERSFFEAEAGRARKNLQKACSRLCENKPIIKFCVDMCPK